MNRAWIGLSLLAASGIGCTTRHSAQPPPFSAGYMEIGPIMDQNGIDVGPLVATRMRDMGVADSHVVSGATGKAQYVEGTATVKHDSPSVGPGGGGIALSVIGTTIIIGGIATGIVGASLSSGDNGGDTLKTISTDLFIGGIALLALGIVAMNAPPPGKARGTVDAKLLLRRPDNTTAALTVKDSSTIYFKRFPDLGLQNLDGLGYGMSSGVLQLNQNRPGSPPPK